MENAVHCQRNNWKLSRAKWKTCWCCFHWGRDLQHRESVQQVKKMLCGFVKSFHASSGEKIAVLLMLLKKDIIFEIRACVFWVRPRPMAAAAEVTPLTRKLMHMAPAKRPCQHLFYFAFASRKPPPRRAHFHTAAAPHSWPIVHIIRVTIGRKCAIGKNFPGTHLVRVCVSQVNVRDFPASPMDKQKVTVGI